MAPGIGRDCSEVRPPSQCRRKSPERPWSSSLAHVRLFWQLDYGAGLESPRHQMELGQRQRSPRSNQPAATTQRRLSTTKITTGAMIKTNTFEIVSSLSQKIPTPRV